MPRSRVKANLPAVLTILEADYGVPKLADRGLPVFDPTEELVSCILSQHTSDANSFPTFERLRARYLVDRVPPTVDWPRLIENGESELANQIRGAGLANQKAKSIMRCLNEIKEKTGGFELNFLAGMPPKEARNWLTALHGVGPKTASIVLCFSFGMDVLPVDTHVFRVAWRLGLVDQKVGEGKAHDILQALIPAGSSFRIHMDFIRHGRAVCKAPTPRCESCSITNYCEWFKKCGPGTRRNELRSNRERDIVSERGANRSG